MFLTVSKSFRIVQNKIVKQSLNKCLPSSFCTSSDNKDDNDKKAQSETKTKSNEALKKLNLLLQQMIDDDSPTNTKSELNLAKPKRKFRNAKTEPGTEFAKSEPVEKQIINAAKNVAESLGGNVKQTESELLSKLLSPPTSDTSEESGSKAANLNDIISGMKIDRTDKPSAKETSRAHQVRQLLDYAAKQVMTKNIRKPQRLPVTMTNRVNLFGTEPLGIFSNVSEKAVEQCKLNTWQKLANRELKLAVTHPPANYFEEMILWTQQGKVWKFPIDNEQGLEEEKNVYFTEHVLLDKHLEPWCPNRGPIRHFMELVCVGLSKNPYITVQAKKDHIYWYRDYFNSKIQLLEEIGAIPTEHKFIQEKIKDK